MTMRDDINYFHVKNKDALLLYNTLSKEICITAVFIGLVAKYFSFIFETFEMMTCLFLVNKLPF